MTATAPARPPVRPTATAPAPVLRRWLVGPTGATLTAAALFLLVWSAAATVSPQFPTPVAVVVAGAQDVAAGQFLGNFSISMQRFLLGMLVAVVVGTLLGLALGTSRRVSDVLGDVTLVGLAVPAVIWALLCTMWFGFGDLAPVLTVVLSAVPFVAVNVAAGARAVPGQLLLMSGSYAVTGLRRVRHVVLPAVAGYVFAGIRFGVMSGWNGLLLSEWFGSDEGVGWRARYWYDANRMPGFLAWVAFFIVFMILTDRVVLESLSRRVFRWRSGRSADAAATARAAA